MDIQIFNHPEFGDVRTIGDFENPRFCLADVCRILQLGNTSQALKRLREGEKRIILIPAKGIISKNTQGGEQNMLAVNEPGLYRLIFASRQEKAVELQDWVYHEVLPSIRKTGSYSLNKSVETAPVPAKKVRRPLSPTACVYALLLSDGTVKIGHTGNLRERVAKIEYKTGLKVTDIYYALTISREAARLIEWVCQKKFSSRKVAGEFFNADFNEVCRVIDFFTGIEVERGERVLKITITMNELTENQTVERALLMEAAKIFVGKIFE